MYNCMNKVYDWLNSLAFIITISFPLQIRNFSLRSLTFLSKSNSPSYAFCKIFRGKFSIGRLPDGNILYFPLDDLKMLEIISEIYNDKIYDVPFQGAFKKVLDVGSHIGLFTLRTSKLSSRAEITAVEANPVNYEYLRKNIVVNRLSPRVRLLNIAAGRQKATGFLYVGDFSRGDSSIKYQKNSSHLSVKVPIFALDDLLSRDEKWDMLKLDVEGAEVDALKGLTKTLPKINLVAMELHSALVHESDVFNSLLNSGLKIKVNKKLYEWCSFVEAER